MRRLSWMIVVLVHAAVLGALFLSGPADVILDAEQYWHLGTLCAKGDFLWRENPIAYRTPGYPAFLGSMQFLAGSHGWQAAIAVQHACLIVTALCVAWMVAQITSSRVWALIAYGLAAAGLVRTWYAQTILTETVFTTVLTLHFVCLLACLKHSTTLRCVSVGLTLGLAILVRPVVQLWWLPAFGLVMFCGAGATTAARFRRSAIGLLAMGAVVSPWMLRNHVIFGEPFLTQFVGRNLWVVTFHQGTDVELDFPTTASARELMSGTGWQRDDPRLRNTWHVSHRLRDAGRADDEIDRLMKRVCFEAIHAEPDRFAKAAIIRCVNFWRCVVNPHPFFGDGTAAPPAGQKAWGNATLRTWEARLYDLTLQRYLRWNEFVTGCVGIGLVCMIAGRTMRPFGLALTLFFVMISGLTALVEIPTVRYRLVLEPLMVVAICSGGAWMTSQLVRRTDFQVRPK